MKNTFFLLVCTFLALTACKSDENVKKEQEEKAQKENAVEKVENEPGYQDIEVLFNEKEFSSADEIKLLKEIQICSDDPDMTANSEIPPCLPDNFKLMKLKEDMSLNNGFILIVKAKTGGFGVRRVLIFQRERGVLVKTNGFVGNVIGRIPTPSGFDNLIIRFRDNDEGGFPMFYNCLFEWKEGKYEFKHVDAIQGPNWGGKVKDADRVEYSKSVYEAITSNNMIF